MKSTVKNPEFNHRLTLAATALAHGQKPLPTPMGRRTNQLAVLNRYKGLLALAFLPLLYFLIFKYVPLWNAQIAFKAYDPNLGILASPFNGIQNFADFFQSIYFFDLMRNTLAYSFLKLAISLPLAIVLAIALYETGFKRLRFAIQNLTYLPHFLSWVIMLGVLVGLLSPDEGLINQIIKTLGGQPINFLQSEFWFPVVVVLSDAWKEMGWSAIIFLAALMAIDPTLYEAADVEGSTRWQRLRYITFPGITDVIVIVLLLRIGNILDAGFYQIFMLYSVPVYSVADIIDTWVYRAGIIDARFDLATAVGLFKGLFGFLLLYTANRLAKRITGSGLY